MTASRSTEHCPLFLDVAGCEVVIVGGGTVSARKAAMMLRYGANVTVVAPEIVEEIESLGVRVARKRYDAADVANAKIVFAATDDAAVNARVAEDCRARGILVNVADAPSRGDFIVPAVIESGPIQIAISTGGHSPALAKRLKDELQPFARLAEMLGALRESAIASLDDAKPLFDSIVNGGVVELLREGRAAEAEARVARLCEGAGVRRA